MLILSRRVGEALCVGPGVTVKIEKVARGRVVIAIDAPRDVPIRRSELPPGAGKAVPQ